MSFPPFRMPRPTCLLPQLRLLLLLLFLLLWQHLATPLCAQNPSIILRDVSQRAGLDYSFGPRRKYGGPSIADLDDDGYPDLLFTHHDKHFIEVYFNQRNGTFYKVPVSKLNVWEDNHALNAFRYGPNSPHVHFTLSRGGAYGRKPSSNRVFRVSRDRSILEVTERTGLNAHGGRGRSTLFLPLRGPLSSNPATTDVLSLNAATLNRKQPFHVAFRDRNNPATFALERASGYAYNSNWYAAPVDFDNNGRIDVVSFETLKFHNVSNRFTLTDVTDSVLPKNFRPVSVVSVVELDFDNDGKWDLYVATTRTGDLKWQRKSRVYRDYLLRNVGGRYVDVTAGSGIPQDGQTRGVTAADLDNDGRVDLVVSKYFGRAVVLRNLGNGKFSPLSGVMPARLRAGTPGDGVSIVDYDLDGRVDVVIAEGDGIQLKRGGFYRLYRNISPRQDKHYLLVRVGSSPSGKATPLHAVVRVRVGATWMARRVGPAGVAVSVSLLETLHFGVGKATVVDSVVVTWLDGTSRWLANVKVDQVLTLGSVAAPRDI